MLAVAVPTKIWMKPVSLAGNVKPACVCSNVVARERAGEHCEQCGAALYITCQKDGCATVNDASRAYAHTPKLFDVTTGSNGTCGGSLVCKAKAGYDGPTGLGTPNGAAAF